MEGDLGLWAIPIAILGGAIRVSTPFIYVALGEMITERSGRINLGLEGVLVMGAMSGYGIAVETGSVWAGVLGAALVGLCLGLMHGALCSLSRVNDIAIGIAMMLFAIGLAYYLGKPYIQPPAPNLPDIPFGFWATNPQLKAALNVNILFLIGIALTAFLAWALRHTRAGLALRVVGDSTDAARAIGLRPLRIRIFATAFGGAMTGVGGAYLSLYYPGSWNENISSGQGLMAVALVIFARWNPWGCLGGALLFGGAGAIGPALQSVGFSQGYHLFYAAPYILTLAIMIATSSRNRRMTGAPAALSLTK
ncbi:ABC transporter permease [Falsihalocynthiibacter arcticus]|nr:ABC transporter permease [Falsihalocynthiibacter arcticus]